MVGQRPGPSLALVQKCCWLELAQSCCRVHLEQQDTCQDPQGSSPAAASRAQPLPGVLTVSPGHTSHSRHLQHPRSPHRWSARHTQRLSP